jgi:S1-C subfamily serine protease
MNGTQGTWAGPILLRAACALLVACLSAPLLAAAQEPPQPAPPGERAKPALTVDALSVVKVRSRTVPDARSAAALGTQREGTGVVIDPKGLVVTIGYLIMEAESVELSTADGRAFPAMVVGYDAATGFGLVRTLATLPIQPVEVGESAKVADRDPVFIVGFDGVAPAYVVSRRPFVGYWEYLLDEAIYTAPATVNWQGAALLNRQGKLVGIGSLAVPDAIGARSQVPGNMFVPIDLLKPLLGDLVARGRSSARPRPWLGVYTQDVEGNVIVTRVSEGGPADRAIRTGDVIVALGGQTLKGQADFYRRLWSSGEAGATISLDVLRDGKIQRVTVKSMDRDRYYRPKPTT